MRNATCSLWMGITLAGLSASLGVIPSGPLYGQQAVERALQQRSNARSVQELRVDQSITRQPEAPVDEPRPSLGPRLLGSPAADSGATRAPPQSPGADRIREERLDQRQLHTRQLREAGGRRQVGRATGTPDGRGERSARAQRFERQQRQQQLNRRINRPRR